MYVQHRIAAWYNHGRLTHRPYHVHSKPPPVPRDHGRHPATLQSTRNLHSQHTKLGKIFDDRQPAVRLLTRLHNDRGVTVSEVIAALEEHAPTVLSTWTARAHEMADLVMTGHWQEDIWTVPCVPHFSLLLDNSSMGQDDFDAEKEAKLYEDDTMHRQLGDNLDLTPEQHQSRSRMFKDHITRHCYVFADGSRKEREVEWILEEMMEPMKSTIHYSINWENCVSQVQPRLPDRPGEQHDNPLSTTHLRHGQAHPVA